MDTIIIAVTVLIGLGIGVLGGYVGRRLLSGRRHEAAKDQATLVLEEAREKHRSLLLEAKEEALKVRSAAESESRERRSELQAVERRLSNREHYQSRQY